MFPDDYLIHGLNALARAHETNYFAAGHHGAAILSAYFLCQEEELEPGASACMKAIIDRRWVETPLCRPFPDEPADPALLARIMGVVRDHATGLRQAGHNIIFPSLALKALRERPDAITPSRVQGICRLVERFDRADPIELADSDATPELIPVAAFAEFALRALLRAMRAFDGRGQGWSGHLLTTARAIIDLHESGHADLAQACLPSFWHYIKRVRIGPKDTDRPRPEHPVSELHPLRHAYWQARTGSDPRFGHVFKYPYGFYGLMRRCGDAELEAACTKEMWHVF